MFFNCFILSVALLGCATIGTDFTIENVTKLRIGITTQEDLVSIFGKPLTDESFSIGDLNTIVLSYGYRGVPGFSDRANSKFIALEFKDNLLNGYYYNSSFPEGSTEFPKAIQDKIIPNKTTRKEVIEIVGNRCGEIRLPTNLLSRLPEEFSKSLSTDAKCILIYQYLYYQTSSKRYLTKYRTLIVSFNQEGVLLNKFFYESNK
jgi:hypothetical protein